MSSGPSLASANPNFSSRTCSDAMLSERSTRSAVTPPSSFGSPTLPAISTAPRTSLTSASPTNLKPKTDDPTLPTSIVPSAKMLPFGTVQSIAPLKSLTGLVLPTEMLTGPVDVTFSLVGSKRIDAPTKSMPLTCTPLLATNAVPSTSKHASATTSSAAICRTRQRLSSGDGVGGGAPPPGVGPPGLGFPGFGLPGFGLPGSGSRSGSGRPASAASSPAAARRRTGTSSRTAWPARTSRRCRQSPGRRWPRRARGRGRSPARRCRSSRRPRGHGSPRRAWAAARWCSSRCRRRRSCTARGSSAGGRPAAPARSAAARWPGPGRGWPGRCARC